MSPRHTMLTVAILAGVSLGNAAPVLADSEGDGRTPVTYALERTLSVEAAAKRSELQRLRNVEDDRGRRLSDLRSVPTLSGPFGAF